MGLEAARIWLGHTDIGTTLRYVYSTEYRVHRLHEGIHRKIKLFGTELSK